MANYGTIHTQPALSEANSSSPSLDFIARAKERGAAALAARRPWPEMAPGSGALGFPPSLGEAYLRIRTNVTYFAANYAIVVLAVVFLSLLQHPVALAVFALAMAAWLFFYFLREEPVVVLSRTIDNRTVLIALSIGTLVLLLGTNATNFIAVSLFLGFAVMLAHAALRKTEDLQLDEESAVPGGWYSVVGVVPATS